MFEPDYYHGAIERIVKGVNESKTAQASTEGIFVLATIQANILVDILEILYVSKSKSHAPETQP